MPGNSGIGWQQKGRAEGIRQTRTRIQEREYKERERERETSREGERRNDWVSFRGEPEGGTGFHGRLITNGRVSRSSAADSQELELHRRRSIASHPASQPVRQPNGLTYHAYPICLPARCIACVIPASAACPVAYSSRLAGPHTDRIY